MLVLARLRWWNWSCRGDPPHAATKAIANDNYRRYKFYSLSGSPTSPFNWVQSSHREYT